MAVPPCRRAAVIVPDGVLFGSSKVHQQLRQELLDNNQLEGIVSLPSGLFKPYAGVSIAIRCQHLADEALAGLLSLKMTDLKKLGGQVGVAERVADQRVAFQWRQAFRAAAGLIVCQEMLLDVSKGLSTDSKSIWEKIEAQLPTFALFKADRESSDGDAEAKNPLQQAVKEAQAALQDQISALEQQIEASVLDVAARTLDKLRKMAPELANELTPRFKEKPKLTLEN